MQAAWSAAGSKSEGETAHVGFHPMTRCCSRRLPNLSPESSLGRVGPITLLYTRSLQDVDALRKQTQRSLGDALWLFEAHCQGMCLSSCVGFSTQDPTPFFTFKTSPIDQWGLLELRGQVLLLEWDPFSWSLAPRLARVTFHIP